MEKVYSTKPSSKWFVLDWYAFKDGSCISFGYLGKSYETYIFFDVNCGKKPNTVGKDIFITQICDGDYRYNGCKGDSFLYYDLLRSDNERAEDSRNMIKDFFKDKKEFGESLSQFDLGMRAFALVVWDGWKIKY